MTPKQIIIKDLNRRIKIHEGLVTNATTAVESCREEVSTTSWKLRLELAREHRDEWKAELNKAKHTLDDLKEIKQAVIDDMEETNK